MIGDLGELWRPIPDFDAYRASSFGRIGSTLPQGQRCAAWRDASDTDWRVLRPSASPQGYYHVTLKGQDGRPKTCKVHLLVIATFTGPRPDGMVCRHLDGDWTNNRPENLAWGTPEENDRDRIRHASERKDGLSASRRPWRSIPQEIFDEILRLLSLGVQPSIVARRFDISRAVIENIAMLDLAR